MDKTFLKRTNEYVDKILKAEEISPIKFDLLFKMAKKMKNTDFIGRTNDKIEIPLNREDTLKRVLNFYKTIDTEYYSKALDFLLQLKNNKKLYILLEI